jgi:hypothetical protein
VNPPPQDETIKIRKTNVAVTTYFEKTLRHDRTVPSLTLKRKKAERGSNNA